MARSHFILTSLCATGLVFAFGCSGAGGSNGGGAGTGATGTGATGTGGGINIGGNGNSGGSGNSGGGWTCTQYEPGAIDVPGNGKDDDCNGKVDDAPTGCDATITQVEDNDPVHAAQAIGLCQISDGNSWGLIEAKYVKADGSPAEGVANPVDPRQHGLLPGFGPAVNVQEGTRMLALSSGTARRPSDAGYEDVGGFDTGSMGTTPPGFPIDSPSCSVQTANDTQAWNPVALELKIKAPLNAKSIKFNFDFYTYEFPVYVCTQYNDFFVALQSPAPTNALQGNISFDSQNNPVSVNNGFLEVCDAQNAGGKNFPCSLGAGQLAGTGFDAASDPFGFGQNHAATGWLETQSPVVGGEIFTLRFAIWDMGDPVLDSSVLIDNFQFTADESTGSVTNPVPVPK
jgi:hypothetical protein